MKRLTCRELGGACDLDFEADSFEDMASMSRLHSMEMLGQKDQEHIEAIHRMRAIMEDVSQMQNWYREKRSLFRSAPDI